AHINQAGAPHWADGDVLKQLFADKLDSPPGRCIGELKVVIEARYFEKLFVIRQIQISDDTLRQTGRFKQRVLSVIELVVIQHRSLGLNTLDVGNVSRTPVYLNSRR